MKYKKVLLPPEPYYSGRVTRYPDKKLPLNRDSGGMVHMKFPI